MYCDGCGNTIGAGMEYCRTCGKRIVANAASRGYVQMPPAATVGGRVRGNVQLLAGLWMVYGALRLFGLAWLFIFGRMILPSIFGAMSNHAGNWNWPYGWQMGSWLYPFGLWFGGVSTVVFAAAYAVLGWALYQRKSWARTLGLVLGFLVLLRIPVGTALGIFTLWVLLPENSRREYEGMTVRLGN